MGTLKVKKHLKIFGNIQSYAMMNPKPVNSGRLHLPSNAEPARGLPIGDMRKSNTPNAKNYDRQYISDGPLPSFNSVAVRMREQDWAS